MEKAKDHLADFRATLTENLQQKLDPPAQNRGHGNH